MRISAWLRKSLFGISPDETRFERRGFPRTTDAKRCHLEAAGRAFVEGYHTALQVGKPEGIEGLLVDVPDARRGFAYEGAAMGLALMDFLSPGKPRRVNAFLRAAGADHIYMVHVGVGWAAARVPWLRDRMERILSRLDTLMGWLTVDGYGFHQTYFNPTRYLREQQVPKHLSTYGRRAFDQGLGRCLWFVEGADISRIRETVDSFSVTRRSDLMSGVGLACAYAGGVGRDEVEQLGQVEAQWRPHVAQGAAFAAQARQRAGNLGEHTEMACEILCGMPARQAAAVTDECLRNLPPDEEPVPAYEAWRQRIQGIFDF